MSNLTTPSRFGWKTVLIAAGLSLFAAQGAMAAKIKLWDKADHKGPSRTIKNAMPNLDAKRFNNRAGSLKIKSGRWEVCTGTHYTGTCRVLSRHVRDLNTLGLNNQISSVRPFVSYRPPETGRYLGANTLNLQQTYLADLDTISQRRAGADVWFEAETPTRLFLKPWGGARMAIWGPNRPNLRNCMAVRKSASKRSLTHMRRGTYLCVQTNRGNIAVMQFYGLSSDYPHTARFFVETHRGR